MAPDTKPLRSPIPRLWAGVVGAALPFAAVTGLAITHRSDALAYTLVGAVMATAAALLIVFVLAQRPAPQPQAAPVAAEPTPEGLPSFGAALEALADPLLVVRARSPDDVAGSRVVFANAAAREFLRIPREGALLVAALRDPVVLEIVDEALFG
ncbi:MAG TPA: ATPase, partial [Caulobacteraceae bacterium]|nr:ATPase [Caulobacteraceae bacterium]